MNKFHRCPDCGKKGVYLKLQHGEDGYLCRYCQWSVFIDPETETEKKALTDFELSIRMARYKNLNEAYEGGCNAHAEHTAAIITAAEALVAQHDLALKVLSEMNDEFPLYQAGFQDALDGFTEKLTALKAALEGK